MYCTPGLSLLSFTHYTHKREGVRVQRGREVGKMIEKERERWGRDRERKTEGGGGERTGGQGGREREGGGGGGEMGEERARF